MSDQHNGPTKAGDPGLRQALFLAADLARKVDPTLAARYHRLYVDAGKHHNSAICTIAAVLVTRIGACWRNGQLYELRDTDGGLITEAEGRKICASDTRSTPPPDRTPQRAQTKGRPTGKESTNPRSRPSTTEPTEKTPNNIDAVVLHFVGRTPSAHEVDHAPGHGDDLGTVAPSQRAPPCRPRAPRVSSSLPPPFTLVRTLALTARDSTVSSP